MECFARDDTLAVRDLLVGNVVHVRVASDVALVIVVRLKLAEQPRGRLELLRPEVLVAHHQHVTFGQGTVKSSARLVVDRPGEVEPDDFRASVIRKWPDGERGHGSLPDGRGFQDGSGSTVAQQIRLHSALVLAAMMIGVQRAISLLTRIASCCWPRFDLSGISKPRSSRRLRTVSSSSALSSALVSLPTTVFGVPLGANKAFQADAWNAAKPASLDVGTFGRVGLRSPVPTA